MYYPRKNPFYYFFLVWKHRTKICINFKFQFAVDEKMKKQKYASPEEKKKHRAASGSETSAGVEKVPERN